MIRLLYFARLREALATGEETLALPQNCHTVSDLHHWLCQRGPAWENALHTDGLFIAVNQTVVDGSKTLNGDEEIAFFPPVTGG